MGPVSGVQPAEVILFRAVTGNSLRVAFGSDFLDCGRVHEHAGLQEHHASVDAATLTPFIEVLLIGSSLFTCEEVSAVYP